MQEILAVIIAVIAVYLTIKFITSTVKWVIVLSVVVFLFYTFQPYIDKYIR